MAKNYKEQERNNLANKFDAQGRSLLSLEEERQAETRKHDKMIKEIHEIVDEASIAKCLPQRKFFILHINKLVEVIIITEWLIIPKQLALLLIHRIALLIHFLLHFIL